MRILSLALLAASTLAFPMFKQCDPRWGNETLSSAATCAETLCTFGGAVTCLAMMLDDCDQEVYGEEVNPSNLNIWLRNNNGFAANCAMYFDKTDLLGGVNFVAKTSSITTLKYYLDLNDIAMVHIRDGHYAMAFGYTGSTFFVNDPKETRNTY